MDCSAQLGDVDGLSSARKAFEMLDKNLRNGANVTDGCAELIQWQFACCRENHAS